MNPDSRIMSFLAKLGDMFILNVLYLVCCIPVITIGAATTALYYNTLKMAENRESYVWREFLRTFKENFKQATIIWMIILVIGAVLVGEFLVMGGIGSDIAVDAADIALVNDDIREVPHLLRLAKRMMVVIQCNLSFSMGLNFLAILLAITGILNPVVGALVHNAGSVVVIVHSAFLLRFRGVKKAR